MPAAGLTRLAALVSVCKGFDEGTVVIRSHGVGKFLYDALEEKGYDPINQIVGYILKSEAKRS